MYNRHLFYFTQDSTISASANTEARDKDTHISMTVFYGTLALPRESPLQITKHRSIYGALDISDRKMRLMIIGFDR